MKKLIPLLLPLLVFTALVSFSDLAMTQDLGRHLKVGEIILDCRCVPDTNLFSYTQPNYPFINHHWLFEVLAFVLYSLGGLNLLMVLKVFLLFVSSALVFYVAVKRTSVWTASLLAPIYLFIFSERFYTRPELMGFVIMGVFLLAIQRFKDAQDTKGLYALPFLEIIWVNSHIYFPVGVGLLLILSIEEFIRKSPFARHVLVVFGVTLLSTLLNPNFVSGALYPLTIFNSYGYSIVENQNIFFLNTYFFNPRIAVFELLIVILIVLTFIHRKRLDIFWVSATLLASVSAFMMIRNFSLFVLASFPLTAYLLHLTFNRLDAKNRQLAAQLAVMTVSVIVTVILVQRVQSSQQYFQYVPGAEKAIAFFHEHQLKGPIFNNFDIGSYLIFRLYPQEKVFVDGRPEAYSVEFFNMYKAMQQDPLLFTQKAEEFNIQTIIFSHTDITPWAQQFLGWVTQSQQWVVIYLDERMLIMVKNTQENKELIDRHRISL